MDQIHLFYDLSNKPGLLGGADLRKESLKQMETAVRQGPLSVAVVLLTLALVMAQIPPAAACTEFILKVRDGGFVIGRSLEFGWNPGYQLVLHPRGGQQASDAPGGKPGVKTSPAT